jgi:hypothetical protein
LEIVNCDTIPSTNTRIILLENWLRNLIFVENIEQLICGVIFLWNIPTISVAIFIVRLIAILEFYKNSIWNNAVLIFALIGKIISEIASVGKCFLLYDIDIAVF